MTRPIASSRSAATLTRTPQLWPWTGSSDPSYRRSWCAAEKWRVTVISNAIRPVYRGSPAQNPSAGGPLLLIAFEPLNFHASMRRYFPDLDHFQSAARSADIVPVYRQLLGDRLTPVTALELLGRSQHAFLLESVVGGEKLARHSFIATTPSLVYQVY